MSSRRRTIELHFRQAPEQFQAKQRLEEGWPGLSDRTPPLCRARGNSSLNSFLLKKMWEEWLWEALWPFMCVPENLHMRVTNVEFNDQRSTAQTASSFSCWCVATRSRGPLSETQEPCVLRQLTQHNIPLEMTTRARHRSKCLLGMERPALNCPWAGPALFPHVVPARTGEPEPQDNTR